jgi:hypothetical protein
MTDTTASPAGGDIHRLLDQAFAGVEMTDDAQDLKEEVRANLVARVSELEAAGSTPGDAARRAIDELGDVRDLVDAATDASPAPSIPSSSAAAAALRNRVRPKPAFVVRIVVASAVAAITLLSALLSAVGALPLPVGVTVALLALGATAVGWIVGDSLTQETSTNHPMPRGRAGGYFLATMLTILGLGAGGLIALGILPLWTVVLASVAFVGGVALFAFLGATQTNRHKAWIVALGHEQSARVGNRFEEEPDTAARFGIYTMVIWVLAFAVFLVVGFAVSWAWSWLALLGGLVAMMLVLARMLFAPRKSV